MSQEPNCKHLFTLRAGLGGTVKHCEKCGWIVKISIGKAPTETKQ
jgi:hypothetical protein